MTAHSHSFRITYSHLHQLIDSRFGIGNQLFDISIVRLFFTFSDNGERSVVQYGITFRHPKDRGRPGITDKLIRGIPSLAGIGTAFILRRISPDQNGQRSVLLLIPGR